MLKFTIALNSFAKSDVAVAEGAWAPVGVMFIVPMGSANKDHTAVKDVTPTPVKSACVAD